MLRRVVVLACVLAAAAASAPAPAVPGEGRVFVHGSKYYPGDDERAPIVLTEGSTLRFTDLSILGHTLTSIEFGPDGGPLFDAGPVPSFRNTVPVEGVEGLPARAEPYRFYCMNHLAMRGSLIVVRIGGTT